MTTVGIDFGVRRLAMAASLTQEWQIEEIVLDKKAYPPGEPHDPVALDRMYCETETWIGWWKPDLVVIERPIQGMSANVSTGLRLAQVVGAIQVACRHAGAATLLVAPSEWKKAVVGVGNADKAKVEQWLASTHPDLRAACASQDSIDAVCMALFAQTVLA